MEVVVTIWAASHAKLQSNCHRQQTNMQLFTGQMPFLSLKQQRQSTEGKSIKTTYHGLAHLKPTWSLPSSNHVFEQYRPPFMRQCWGLPHRLAQCMSPQGWRTLVNAALLSSMRRVYVVLPSSLVNSLAPLMCRHDRVTQEAGRVGLMGRDRGRRGYWVHCTCLFILPGF